MPRGDSATARATDPKPVGAHRWITHVADRPRASSSQYSDILSAGTVLNFTAVVYLWTQSRGRGRTAITWLAAAWLGAVAFGVVRAVPGLYRDIQTKIAESKEQERRVRAYLRDGDPKVLFEAGPMEIPYPDAARLQAFLDDPTIRSFLPAGFVPAPAVN